MTLRRSGTVTGSKARTKHIFANHELVVLAAYLAGAQKVSADTEDIAVKANELAPAASIGANTKIKSTSRRSENASGMRPSQTKART